MAPLKHYNDTTAEPDDLMRFPVIAVGTSIFKRERNEKYMPSLRCRYRLSQKNMEFLLKYQRKRRINIVDKELFLKLLNSQMIPVADFFKGVSEGGLLNFENKKEKCPEKRAQFSCNDDIGAVLVQYKDYPIGACAFLVGQGLMLQVEQNFVDEILLRLAEVD